MHWDIDLTAQSSIQSGVTRHFQAFYRDAADPDGLGFNLSDGYTVMFTQ